MHGNASADTQIAMSDKRNNLQTYLSKVMGEYDKIQGVELPITPPQQEQKPILQETIEQVAQAAKNVPELIGMHGGDVDAGVVPEPVN